MRSHSADTIRKKAVENAVRHGNSGLGACHIREILGMFDWATSPEGYDFWGQQWNCSWTEAKPSKRVAYGKTIKGWFDTLPSDIAYRANRQRLRYKRYRVVSLAVALTNGLPPWASTEEGFSFWATVYKTYAQ